MEEIILPAVLPSRYTSCTVLQADEKNGDGRDDVLNMRIVEYQDFCRFPADRRDHTLDSKWLGALRRDFDRDIFHSFVVMR